MKFEFIKEVAEPVMSYGVMVSTGDVVEFEGWIAQKAKTSPNYKPLGDVIEEPAQILTAPIHPEPAKFELEDSPEFTLERLRVQWQDKFGTKPHHKKSAETLRRELSDGD